MERCLTEPTRESEIVNNNGITSWIKQYSPIPKKDKKKQQKHCFNRVIPGQD